jgi:hypothetical protein
MMNQIKPFSGGRPAPFLWFFLNPSLHTALNSSVEPTPQNFRCEVVVQVAIVSGVGQVGENRIERSRCCRDDPGVGHYLFC